MKPEHEAILNILRDYLTKHPSQRFGQALFNLNITQFADPNENIPGIKLTVNRPTLRDIYNDTDADILKRIGESVK